jgi:hypothetical protein
MEDNVRVVMGLPRLADLTPAVQPGYVISADPGRIERALEILRKAGSVDKSIGGTLVFGTQRVSTTKQLEAARKRRGKAAVDGDQEAVVKASAEIAAAEARLREFDAIEADADQERTRRDEAEAPLRRKRAHTTILAGMEGAQARRLESVERAEQAARALVASLRETIADAEKAYSAALQMASWRGDKSAGDPASEFNPTNVRFRLSLLLSSVFLPLCPNGFFGHLNMTAAGYSQIPPETSWREREEREGRGLIGAFKRQAP